MGKIKQCTVRFNLEKPEAQKAWERLQNRDRKKYGSYSDLISEAVNAYFDKSENAADIFERRLLKRINAEIKKSFAEVLSSKIVQGILNCEKSNKTTVREEETEDMTEDIDWDFLGS